MSGQMDGGGLPPYKRAHYAGAGGMGAARRRPPYLPHSITRHTTATAISGKLYALSRREVARKGNPKLPITNKRLFCLLNKNGTL